MRFTSRKRKHPPAIIIVSLIDVLIVLLIFMMVSTTFKKQPSIKLALPESKQAQPGVSSTAPFVITIAKTAPHLYIEDLPLTLDKLQSELKNRAAKNPSLGVALAVDRDAPWGQVVQVMDAIKAANLKTSSAFTKSPGEK